MITRTEILQAIARCEPHAGFASIDHSLTHPGTVSKGDLFALIEAAKCARYVPVSSYTPISDADFALSYEAPIPTPAVEHDDELDGVREQLAESRARVRELEMALTDAAGTLRRAI